MPHLSLRFLGGLDVQLDAEPVTAFGADKVRALLAYLAIESSRPHRRAELSAIFWPDLSEVKAAHNLSQSLLRLRRALGEPKDPSLPSFVFVTPQTVQFNSNSDCRLDVSLFRELLNSCVHHRHGDAANCEVCVQWLRQAADLYRGNLLAGLFVPDSVAFEEWRLVQQEGLHAQALETLTRLIEYYERRGDFKQVQEYARRLIALEPWSEEAQLKLMQALVQGGHPSVALRQYESYQRALEEELDIQPSADVTAFYEQIRAGEAAEQASTAGNNDVVWLSSEGERRQITALLCNHAGIEDSDDAINTCERHCAAIFNRFGGRRAQRQGDACLIYFGYPQAFEDAARRAIHSGLEVAARLGGENSPVRIGIHTGMMTIGEKRGRRWQDRDLLGKTPEIARECLRLAEAGEVIVTEDIQRLTQDSFDFQSSGSSPIGTSVYRVLGERAVQSRLEWLAQTQRLTAFVGHEAELTGLRSAHEKLLRGEGQVVLLRGEPGIGKSRLVWELQQSIPIIGVVNTEARQDLLPVLWLTGRCLPHYQNTSLYPIVGLLEGLLGFQAEDSPEVRKEKLTAMLALYQLDRPSALWLLSLLLGLPTETPAPETITKAQREQVRELMIALLQKRAAEQPLVLLIEDLQWSDPSTAEWLSHSVESLTSVPCLTILTARPNFKPAWVSEPDARSKLLVLSLDPLSPEQAEAMMMELAGGRVLSKELRTQIVTQTDGIPLFIEELTKSVLERPAVKAGRNRKFEIPASLVDSLIARLDHLGVAKETAQWAAVLGREFSYSILQGCIPYDEQRLQSDLGRLIEAELVSPLQPSARDSGPMRPGKAKAGFPARYTFKHALAQEAAYSSMLKNTRKFYHRRIAEMLETRFSQIATTRPELMAQHYFEAGLPSQAVDFWIKAGERAMTQGATLEARNFFDCALEEIELGDHQHRWETLKGREKVLEKCGERDAQKVDIEALHALAQTLSDDTCRAYAYLRETTYVARQGDYKTTLALANEAYSAARQAGDLKLELNAQAYKAQTLVFLQDMDTARKVVEETLAQIDQLADDGVRAQILSSAAHYYLELSDFNRAVQLLSQSIEIAHRAANYQGELSNNANLGMIYTMLGLYPQARSILEMGRERAELFGDQWIQAGNMRHLGFVYWCTGELDRAKALNQKALEMLATAGDMYGQATCHGYLGYVYKDSGDLSLAAQHLALARQMFEQIGLDSDKLEAQVVEASILLAQGRGDDATQMVTEAWNYIRQNGLGDFSAPALVCGCIADVLAAIQHPGISSHEVVETGYRDLMRRAEKISDPEWRRSFLENVAENREIVQRLKG